MRIHDLLPTTKFMTESALHQDKVDRMIQKTLWPLVKPLEMKLSNGTTVTRKDRDGSVLAAMKQKSAEIINQYSGKHKQTHLDVINAATDYKQILKLMTNVMLYNMGVGVVKEAALKALNEGINDVPHGEFRSNTNGLDVHHYETHYSGADVAGTVYVSDDSIKLDPRFQDEVGYVEIKFSTLVSKSQEEISHSHSNFELAPAQSSDPTLKSQADEYLKKFQQKYEQYLSGNTEHDMLDLLGFVPDESKIQSSI